MGEHFLCPLCGRQRPVKGWNPYFYRDEIIIREIVGLGRGRGFLTVSQRATKGTDRLDLTDMARRCLRIVGICMDTYVVSASELIDDVPEELVDEIVREKAEDYGYKEEDAE